ncbi:MAG TPA: GH116 family glycosyl-hydrolase, partial [Segetibacter sp.]
MTAFKALKESSELTKIKDFVNEDFGDPVAFIHSSSTVKGSKSFTADFVISWYVPNLSFKEIPDKGRYYANQFKNAAEVATYIAGKFRYLKSKTMLWHRTWYESTLPWWFMERTFSNTSVLATTTCHRMASGRYYAWEG